MTYDWKPSATRSATTNPGLAAVRHARTAAADQPRDILVAAAIEEFIEAAEDGRVRNRSGRPYMPNALRDLRGALRHQVARDLGDLGLRAVRRRHVQAMVDRLEADRLSESRIRSIVSALRALYGYAVEQGYVDFSPADGVLIARDHLESDAHQREQESHEAVPEARPSERYGGDYQPVALLPERILSLALRIAVVLFILFVLVTLAESA